MAATKISNGWRSLGDKQLYGYSALPVNAFPALAKIVWESSSEGQIRLWRTSQKTLGRLSEDFQEVF
ncbi:hypothetical protein F2Q69_00040876 [Brassica cretica]|uniref:Uncharacterized protein n=1 Tax=Brassica cretica TaxID=69181 RepID=A0A8S9NQK5_BRACR|nr:hypothetical protein F2Q69_00040876 [Brassica cretica]